MSKMSNDPVLLIEEAEFKNALKEYLQTQLPDEMIPKHIVLLDELPTMANGKIDRNQLPELKSTNNRITLKHTPSTKLEKSVAEVWCNILHTENVDLEDNFLELGGGSLNTVQMLSMIKDKHHISPGIQEFLSNPTIKAIIKYLETYSNVHV